MDWSVEFDTLLAMGYSTCVLLWQQECPVVSWLTNSRVDVVYAGID